MNMLAIKYIKSLINKGRPTQKLIIDNRLKYQNRFSQYNQYINFNKNNHHYFSEKINKKEELKFKDDIENLHNLMEYKSGLQNLMDAKYTDAESHFKESLKILKNSNQTDTYTYLYILRK